VLSATESSVTKIIVLTIAVSDHYF